MPYRTCSCPSRTPRLGLLRTWPQLTFTIEVTRRCPAPSFPRVTACLQKKKAPTAALVAGGGADFALPRHLVDCQSLGDCAALRTLASTMGCVPIVLSDGASAVVRLHEMRVASHGFTLVEFVGTIPAALRVCGLSSAWVTGVRKRGGKEQAPRAEGEAAEGETQDESPVPTACEATLCAGPPKGPGGTHEERSHAPAAAPTTPRARATPAFLGPRPVACVRQPRPPDLASGGQAGRRALAAVEWDRAGSQKHTPQAQASAAPQPGRRRGRHAEHPKQGR